MDKEKEKGRGGMGYTGRCVVKRSGFGGDGNKKVCQGVEGRSGDNFIFNLYNLTINNQYNQFN
jgi:hypothetical protein